MPDFDALQGADGEQAIHLPLQRGRPEAEQALERTAVHGHRRMDGEEPQELGTRRRRPDRRQWVSRERGKGALPLGRWDASRGSRGLGGHITIIAQPTEQFNSTYKRSKI